MTVVSLVDIAMTFPKRPLPCVERATLLDTIESIFDAGLDVVFLEGPEGSGKTVALSQYATRFSTSTLSLFFTTHARLGTESIQVQFDLANQIHWLLNAKQLEVRDAVHLEAFRNYLFVLSRHAARYKQTFTFVIDGLDGLRTANSATYELLLNSLPFGSKHFRFLFSGLPTTFSPPFDRSVRNHRIHTIGPFSLLEAEELMEGLNLAAQDVAELTRTVKGSPARLTEARRLLVQGMTFDDISERSGKGASALLDAEWASAALSPQAETLLAAITFVPESRDVSLLARIVEEPIDQVIQQLCSIGLIAVDANEKTVTFISESLHRYAEKRLRPLEDSILERLARTLSIRPDEAAAVRLLPDVLLRQAKLQELESYLSQARIEASLRTFGAIGPVAKRLQGIEKKAAAAGADMLFLRTLLQRCGLSALSDRHILVRQVNAALALDDERQALTVANGAELEEYRAQLLSLIAKDQRRRGLEPSESIVSEVTRIASRIEFATLGDRAVEMAQDLAYVSPELAASALRAYAKDSADPNALDVAIVRLSIEALARRRDAVGAHDPLLEVDKLAGSQSTHELTKTLGLLWNRDDPERLMRELHAMTSTGEKVFFLRQWIGMNRSAACAARVAFEAAQIMLADTAYAPNATVFRDLGSVLKQSQDSETAARLASILESQSSLLRNTGPIVDYFRMRLFLVYAPQSQSAMQARLLQEAIEIDDLQDSALKASSFAWLLRTTLDLRLGDEIPDPDDLKEFARSGLNKAVNVLLSETAQHTDAVRGVLQALAPLDLELVLSIASRINTQARRDAALHVALGAILREGPSHEASHFISVAGRLLSAVKGDAAARDMRREVFWYLCEHVEQLGSTDAFGSMITSLLSAITDPDERLVGLATLCGRTPGAASRWPGDLTSKLLAEWNKIEDDSDRVIAGLRAVENLGRGDPATALALHREVQAFLTPRFAQVKNQPAARRAVILVGRALAALAEVGDAQSEDLRDMADALSVVTSEIEKARLASRCALFLVPADRGLAEQVVRQWVIPIVSSTCTRSGELTAEARTLVIDAAPAMFLFQESAAFTYIDRLDGDDREFAFGRILEFIVFGRVPREPWNKRGELRTPVTEEVLTRSIQVLEKVADEEIFALFAIELFERMRDRERSNRLNDNQKEHFVGLMNGIARKKFPSPTGVQHDGYLLLFDAYLLSIRRRPQTEWEALRQKVTVLPNLSDACFVMAMALPLIPKRLEVFRREWREWTLEIWRRLPTLEERMVRLETFYEHWSDDFPLEVKGLVKECVEKFEPDAVTNPRRQYRALVEMAHKFDEEWAASLASVTDADPVRAVYKTAALTRLEDLELRRKVRDARSDLEPKENVQQIGRACRHELGVLAATRSTMQDWEGVLSLLKRVSATDLSEVEPVLSYAITCVGLKYRNVPSMRERVRAFYRAVVQSIVLARAARLQTVGPDRDVTGGVLSGTSVFEMIVRPHERSDALRSLETWLGAAGGEELDVVDPYFRPEDVELLSLVQRIRPDLRLRILTSARNQESTGAELAHAFKAEWNRLQGSADPPAAIVLIGGRESDGELGIHDRWWLLGEKGLEFGTSFSGLGKEKLTKIRELDGEQVTRLRAEVEDYFALRRRSLKGERVDFHVVSF